jgi:hypothetical protein
MIGACRNSWNLIWEKTKGFKNKVSKSMPRIALRNYFQQQGLFPPFDKGGLNPVLVRNNVFWP